MQKGDVRLTPLVNFTDTKANIEAIANPVEGMTAQQTDSPYAQGRYANGTWVWGGAEGGSVDSVTGDGVDNTDPVNPVLTYPVSSDILMPTIGAPAINTISEDFTTRGSAGVIDGTITYVEVDTGTRKVKVAAGEGYIRTTNDQQGELKIITWAAVTQIDIPAPAAGQETVRFIGIEYNAGSPQVTTRTTFNWNWYSDFPLARVSIDALGVMHILNAYAHSEDTANLTRKFLRMNFPFHREEPPEGSGGVVIGVTGTRYITLSTGYIWHGYNRYLVPAFDTSVTGSFDLLYRRAGGGYTGTAGNTQWPNTQYDDGSGTLATMTAAKYACLWVYLDLAETSTPGFDIIYGRGEYTSVINAQAESAPSPLPDHLTYHGRLLARIIFKKSDNTTSLLESAWINQLGNSTLQNASEVSFTPAGAIAATNVQAAIEELDSEKLPNVTTTALGDFIIGNGSGVWIKQTLAQIKNLLGVIADAANDNIYYVRRNLGWTNLKTYTDTLYAALAGSASQVFSVGAATALAHAPTTSQIQLQSLTAYNTGGTATAFTITTLATGANLTTNESWHVIFGATAGASPTLNRDGKGAKALMYYNAAGTKMACGATTIVSGMRSDVVYDGVDYVVVSPLLGTAAYTAASDYAVAAKGVTNGDTHDHIGGDGTLLPYVIPFGVYQVINPLSATGNIYLTGILRDMTLVNWRQAFVPATTNDASNYWTIKLLGLDATLHGSFTTIGATVGAWNVNDMSSFTDNSFVATQKGLYIRCEKTGASAGNLNVAGPWLEATRA